MEFTLIKQTQTRFDTAKTTLTLIGFTVFLTILALGSCGLASETAPSSGPQLYMSFTLTNADGTEIDPTTPLSRSSTYGLVITPASGTTIPTANYDITFTPPTAITGIATNTNSVDFTVNNTADTTLIITVAHRTDSSVSKTVTLTLDPQADYMSFALTNRSGTAVNPTTLLSRNSTYGLVITPVNGAPTPTADYTITYTPATAITGIATNTNSVDFTVNNTADTTLIVTVVHRTDSSISKNVTLKLAPQLDYMSFALTNRSGTAVNPTTPLSRGSTYGLVIAPGSGVVPATADYIITPTPAAAITTNVVRTNSVDFRVNNTADTTVTFTVAHRTDSSISETITLNLDPQADYMSFALTNRSGAAVDPTTELSRGSTYGLVITPTSGTTIPTADYIITPTPAAAITRNVTRTNSVDFRVNNTADRTFTFTVAHRTNSSVSQTITLNLAPQADYMSFILTNASGDTVATTTQLYRNSIYGLIIAPRSGVIPATADYVVTYTPAAAITRNVTRTNSVDFTVNNTADTSVTFTFTHRTDSSVSQTITLNLAPQAGVSFQQDIKNATVPNLTLANALTREVLAPLNVITGTPLEKRYVTESGAGTQDGSSWANAWAGTSLRSEINAIIDANIGRVYLVMVAGGTYKPGTSRGDSFSMKNYVAIMGGFQTGGGWGRTGTTIFSGDIGTVGTTTDNSYNVFRHSSIALGNAHLYGVTITGGNANGPGAQNSGGGMYNTSSSPVLTEVVFSENNANGNGGGMFNQNSSSPVLTSVVLSENTANWGGGMYNQNSSSPVLTSVVLSGNTANGSGGGMYNVSSSSPVLTSVVLSRNIAINGGGMYNQNSSSPVLTEVVFSENNARWGGGMYNTGASSALTRVVFSKNTANSSGGGMFNNNSSPVLTGVVFNGNTANSSGGGMFNNNSSPVLTGVVFNGNIAASIGGGMYNRASSLVVIGSVFRNNRAVNGGAMYNDNGGQVGPLIANTIFSGNMAMIGSTTGVGPDIVVSRAGGGAENIRIAGSVLGIGLAQPTNAIVGIGGSDALNISYHSLANGAASFGVNATLTINGMNFPYPIITAGSSAINLGLYVRKNGNTYYFSETGTGTSWHTSFTSTGAGGLDGTAADLPTTGTNEDITATDFAGNARSGRPDAGVYELR